MPNWCENTLVVSGPKTAVKEFARKGRTRGKDKTELSLEKFYPTPPETLGNDANKGMPDWYNWRVTNWGTKWDLCLCEVRTEEFDGTIEYYFDTAWSPPITAFKHISTMYPKLRFELRFFEPGVGFAGKAVIQNGLCEETEMTMLEFKLEFDPVFQKEHDDIQNNMTSEQIRDDLLEEQINGLLEPLAVARLAKKDLAALVDHDFMNRDAQELFEKRLKKGK